MLYILLLRNLTVGLSWDKVKGKSAKSIDKKDIGKIKELSEDYIQIQKGLVSKDNFFVPKYHVEGYEDDDIILSLTEDEIISKFMNKSNPSADMLDDDSYKKRKEFLKNKYPNFEEDIPQYSPLGSGNVHDSTSEVQGAKMSWDKIMDKKVKSSDDEEMGKIRSVSQYFGI
jgi:hypothetical protein